MKNMIIDLSTGINLLAYTRGGQTRYRMGDSVVEEAEISDPKVSKLIKKFVEQEDKNSMKDLKEMIKEDEEDKDKKKDGEGDSPDIEGEEDEDKEGDEEGGDDDLGELG